MKHKFSKPVSLILALLIVLLQFGVVTANACEAGQATEQIRPAASVAANARNFICRFMIIPLFTPVNSCR